MEQAIPYGFENLTKTQLSTIKTAIIASQESPNYMEAWEAGAKEKQLQLATEILSVLKKAGESVGPGEAIASTLQKLQSSVERSSKGLTLETGGGSSSGQSRGVRLSRRGGSTGVWLDLGLNKEQHKSVMKEKEWSWGVVRNVGSLINRQLKFGHPKGSAEKYSETELWSFNEAKKAGEEWSAWHSEELADGRTGDWSTA